MNGDLQQRLEALGSAPAPDLDRDRLDTIVERAMAATEHTPGRRRPETVLLVAAAVVVLLVAGVLAAGGPASDTLRITAADGVTVELDGDRSVGLAGQPLAEGALVDVASDGSVVVDGRRYGPGRYVVIDGRLEPVTPASPSTTVATVNPGVPPPPVGPATTAERVGTNRSTTSSPRPSRDDGRSTTTNGSDGNVIDDRSRESTVPRRPPATDRPTTTTERTRSATTTTRPTTTRPTTTRPTTTTTRPTTTTETTRSTTVPIDRTRDADSRPTTTTTTSTTTTTTTTTTSTLRDRPPVDRP